jgi:VWFA-related protein
LRRKARRFQWIALLGLLCLAQTSSSAPSLEPRLLSFWDDWLADVDPLLQPDERETLRGLEPVHQRERAIEAFWSSRGEPARRRWQRNLLGAAQLRPRSPEARRATLLLGKPNSRQYVTSCGGLRALEIWRWGSWELDRQGGRESRPAVVIFAQANNLDSRSYLPWDPALPGELGFAVSPDASLDDFLGSIQEKCLPADLERTLREAVSLEGLVTQAPWPTPDTKWLESLVPRMTTSSYPARLQISFLGAHGRYTILRGRLRLPAEELGQLDSGILFDRIAMVGDVFRGGHRVDSFEIVHHVAGTPPDAVVELDFHRRLRAGAYRMDLRVTDIRGRALLRADREVVVPALETRAPEPPGRVRGFERLTGAEVVLLDTFPAVEVLPVVAKGAREVDVRAITTGGPIAAVEFRLDQRSLAVDSEPPYAVRIAIDSGQPEVEALALDSEGAVLARHTRRVEHEGLPLAVRLREPLPGATRAVVDVTLPRGEQISRVECFHSRRRVATLLEAPFACELPEPPHIGLQYVRAQVTLASGDSAEHLLFLGPDAPETVDVRLVELFASVRDGSGRLVTGLTAMDFEVNDGGEPRELVEVESLANLPISVAVLTDLSSSMGRLTELASQSAQRFFESILVADDLGSLLAFNHDLHQLVPFTADAQELRHGAYGLRGLGSTRLHDGVAWALSQFSGQENRRALVVLSDGGDVDSDFLLEQVIRAAVRAGVAVFPISLVRRAETPPESIGTLADRTGGRSFTAHSVDQLDGIYRRIEEELRSQYLLVYRMPNAAWGLDEHRGEVKVLRSGLTVRNVHGHYQ